MDNGEWVEEWADVESDEREARAYARAAERYAKAQAWEYRALIIGNIEEGDA